MDVATDSGAKQKSPSEENNFNFLRLLFAILVLVSHSYEIIDGNRSREPLTLIFNSLSLGELAVDAFFFLSGFLIVQSWRSKPSLRAFILARVLRIYPGFIVASLFCAFLFGPLASDAQNYFERMRYPEYFGSVIALRGPVIPPVFNGSWYPFINNSLWTIKYEMACYIFVAMAGVIGLAHRFVFWIVVAILGCAGLVVLPALAIFLSTAANVSISGPLTDVLRLFSFFSVGAVYQAYQSRIIIAPSLLGIAVLLLFLSMFFKAIAELALAIFGTYILFGIAFARNGWLRALKPRFDISYGVYLYAWPVQHLLIYYFPGLDVAPVIFATAVISVGFGWLSWRLVESPALRLKRHLLKR